MTKISQSQENSFQINEQENKKNQTNPNLQVYRPKVLSSKKSFRLIGVL